MSRELGLSLAEDQSASSGNSPNVTSQGLQTRLTIYFLAIGLLPLMITGGIAWWLGSASLQTTVENQLAGLRDAKSREVQKYFSTIRKQALTFSESKTVVHAMKQFTRATEQVKDEVNLADSVLSKARSELEGYYREDFGGEYANRNGKGVEIDSMLAGVDGLHLYLQHQFIIKNPHPLGEKEKMDENRDGTYYSNAHREFHPVFRNYLYEFGYYDIFLVEPKKGVIVYSVFKELDFQTSLQDGPYAETNFGEVFRMAKEAGEKGENGVFLVDFEPYRPSYDGPASFVASPILFRGEFLGVLIMQMPLGNIKEMLKSEVGLGETGETILVGPDGLLRSDSRRMKKMTVEQSFAKDFKVDTPSKALAMKGETGAQLEAGYAGDMVISAYAPVDLEDFSWVILAQMSRNEALRGVDQLTWYLGGIGVVGLIVILIVGRLAGKGISRPIEVVVEKLSEVSSTTAAASSEITAASQSLAEGSSQQAASLEETSASLEEMASMAARTATNTGDTRKKSSEMRGVAAEGVQAMEKMNHAVGSTLESSRELSQALERIQTSSQGISKIMKTIDEIAFQTNILALNAAVEAARAGEAGAGFAVVADEVRSLAQRSTDAASEVASMVKNSMETADAGEEMGRNVAERMQAIVEEIENLGAGLTRVGSAVDGVDGAVEEISTAADEQSTGIQQLNIAVQEMDRVVQQNAATAEETSASAALLNDQVESLDAAVQELRAVVRGS